MVNEVGLFQLNVLGSIVRISFMMEKCRRQLSNLFSLRDVSLFSVLAYKSYHSNSIIGDIFKIFSKVMSYVICMIFKNRGMSQLWTQILFLKGEGGDLGPCRETKYCWPSVAGVRRKQILNILVYFYFPSLILKTNVASSQCLYFKNSHFITSLNLMPTPTGFLMELELEETGKCFKWFLCILEVSWLGQGKTNGKYNNRRSHCVVVSDLLISIDFLVFIYSF